MFCVLVIVVVREFYDSILILHCPLIEKISDTGSCLVLSGPTPV